MCEDCCNCHNEIEMLENQVADLKAELSEAENRVTKLTDALEEAREGLDSLQFSADGIGAKIGQVL